ncbi:MAG TPA: hypothetical protein VGI10_22425 [Polyangiaceae bacterium]|jgi:hypothetical protein
MKTNTLSILALTAGFGVLAACSASNVAPGRGHAGSAGAGNTGNTGNVGTGNTGNVGTGNTGNVGTGNTGNVGTGNTGNTGTSGSVGTGGGVAMTGPLLDDLTDGDNTIAPYSGRVGYWYSYNDATGTQWPPSDPSGATPFLVCPSSATDCLLGPGHTPAPAADFWAETHGTGFTVWGAGMGFDLNDTGTKMPYDATAYNGISFWGKANAATPVRAKIQIPTISKVADGGTCVPPADPMAMGQCDNQYGIAAMFTTGWTQFMMPFATITQEDWGGKNLAPPFTKNSITDVQWQVAQGVAFDIAVDDITFY